MWWRVILLFVFSFAAPAFAQTPAALCPSGGQPYPDMVILNGLPDGGGMIFVFRQMRQTADVVIQLKGDAASQSLPSVETPPLPEGVAPPYSSAFFALKGAKHNFLLIYAAWTSDEVGLEVPQILTWIIQDPKKGEQQTWMMYLGKDKIEKVEGGPMPASSFVTWRCAQTI